MTDGSPTPLREAAVQMHELFTELLRAGFTELQACRVLGMMMANGNSQDPDTPPNT